MLMTMPSMPTASPAARPYFDTSLPELSRVQMHFNTRSFKSNPTWVGGCDKRLHSFAAAATGLGDCGKRILSFHSSL